MTSLEIKDLRRFYSYFVYSSITISLFLVGTLSTWAQCPMCKASAESNLRDGGTAALGLNTGIIYLFLTPYILVMSLVLLWWWNNKRNKKRADTLSTQ